MARMMFKFALAFTCMLMISCVKEKRFDSEQTMYEKCKNLKGLDKLILDSTTIDDIYKSFPIEDIKKEDSYSPNLDEDWDKNFEQDANWTRITIENYSTDYHSNDVDLDFYKDTLTEIHFRYDGYWSNKENIIAPESFLAKYGYGIPVTQEYLDSFTIDSYSSSFNETYNDKIAFRKYQNNDVHMILWSEHWDIVIIHKPRLKRLLSAIQEVKDKEHKYIDYDSEYSNGHNSMDADDEEYWRSVNREKALKDAGLDNAARMERKARQNYLRGGGYTSPNGGSQIHYQGSKEQKQHLEEMSRRGW